MERLVVNDLLTIDGYDYKFRSITERTVAEEMVKMGLFWLYEPKKHKLGQGSEPEIYIPDFAFEYDSPWKATEDKQAVIDAVVNAYNEKHANLFPFKWIEAKYSDAIRDLYKAIPGLRDRMGPYLQGAGRSRRVEVEFNSSRWQELPLPCQSLRKAKILAEQSGENVLCLSHVGSDNGTMSILMMGDGMLFEMEHPIANFPLWKNRIKKQQDEAEEKAAKEARIKPIKDEILWLWQTPIPHAGFLPNRFAKICFFCDKKIDAGDGWRHSYQKPGNEFPDDYYFHGHCVTALLAK